MALVRYSVFYNGPFAVYTSRTGLTDIRTGLAELGGGFNVGDFMDLTEAEAQSWSQQYTAQGAALSTKGVTVSSNFAHRLRVRTSFQGSVVGIAPADSTGGDNSHRWFRSNAATSCSWIGRHGHDSGNFLSMSLDRAAR